MEIFGIGPLELLFIILLALIIIGPRDLQEKAGAAGRWLRKASQSQFWLGTRQFVRTLRALPGDLIQQAGLEQDAPMNPPASAERRRSALIESWVADPEPSAGEPSDSPSGEELPR
jgi:hypothetical protein